jgi:clan AA aspartic protease
MGLFHAEIELINGADLVLAQKHIIGEEEIKRMKILPLVDTGAITLCINENIQEILQFPVIEEKRRSRLANGQIAECDVVAPVEIRFKDRRCLTSAIVLPGDSEPLLGAIPLEEMNVLINPLRQELTPAHPDMVISKLLGIRPLPSDREFI